MNTIFLTFFLILVNILILIPLKKIICLDKITNDLVFIYLSNLILLFSLIYFIYFNYIIMFCFYISFFLMIFAYLLIYNIKNILGRYNIFSIPYFILSVYIFSNVSK
jgi:hypothetical protein